MIEYEYRLRLSRSTSTRKRVSTRIKANNTGGVRREVSYIFSMNIGPNYAGKIRDIDVKTLEQVGEMIREQGE